jgi:protein tyrosine phosphatase (PTP) superfamily phosphohydrolase (DUF442 family)
MRQVKAIPLNRVCARADTERKVCFVRSDNIYHAFKTRDSCETRSNVHRSQSKADRHRAQARKCSLSLTYYPVSLSHYNSHHLQSFCATLSTV